MTYQILIQRAAKEIASPSSKRLRLWATHTLQDRLASAELTIRLVNETEMTDLNTTYRQKKGSTNVLSFPFDMPADIDMGVPLLGDIVICSTVVNQEAIDQEKSAEAHWAHMVVHGTLHLLGYNHEVDDEAIVMEALETTILQTLGFPNPYQHPKKD
jgi:probable rRNA maturation factor